MDEKDKIIKDAQYRKGLNISFFNSVNNAIELTKMFYEITGLKPTAGEVVEQVNSFRNILFNEYANYYAKVIANVGLNFKPENTIANLKSTTNLNELNTMWRNLSADERKNAEIIKTAQELKKAYESL